MLSRAFIRHLRAHPWLVLLCLVGIGTGVSVVVALDIVNASIAKAFTYNQRLFDQAITHKIVGHGNTLDEQHYKTMRVELGIRHIAPLVEAHISAVEHDDMKFKIVGIDPFAEGALRPHLLQLDAQPQALVGQNEARGSVLMAKARAQELGLKEGSSLTVRYGFKRFDLKVVGLLVGNSQESDEALAEILLGDIADVQALLEMPGRLSAVHGNFQKAPEELERLKNELPKGLRVIETTQEEKQLQSLTENFNMNLDAMSLLGLLVGLFLIYNTMIFLVTQRRTLLGLFRTHGVSRRQIFTYTILEAMGLGFMGSLLGIGFGIVLANLLLGLVTQTINDHYFVVAVRELQITPESCIKGIGLGTLAALSAAIIPAWEATKVQARTAISRMSLETHATKLVWLFALVGFGLTLFGILISKTFSQGLMPAYALMTLAIVGGALFAPLLTLGLTHLLNPLFSKGFGHLGRLAIRSIQTSLSRSGIATAALGLAIATMIGVTLMVSSFRLNVSDWLKQTLLADIYISMPNVISSQATPGDISPEIVKAIASIPGVKKVGTNRTMHLQTNRGKISNIALNLSQEHFQRYRFKDTTVAEAWPKFHSGEAVIISEPLANKKGFKIGERIYILHEKGEIALPIAGTYYDYSSERGHTTMHAKTYAKYWQDPNFTALAAYLHDGASTQEAIEKIHQVLPANNDLLVRSTKGLQQASLAVFDRTFAITGVLRLLAAFIAFIGIISALMCLQLEREREFAILKAQGFTPSQLIKLLLGQTTLMGLIAGIMSIPLGIGLGHILTQEINMRSFGWSIESYYTIAPFVEAFALAMLASCIAGIYPAWHLIRHSPLAGLREST